ncbi:hypothetical protein O9K51_08789 [Purpureocillium lavendulum]|uniref:C2H2-type domain-containing protein n=1 Tax=Purpureocillium lavendulum TaxID=1247861 RepID=A0AB34FGT2_9HYPO|nr:hypothetical protein O9K51_08789 [Purpureocillium lavendulum]
MLMNHHDDHHIDLVVPDDRDVQWLLYERFLYETPGPVEQVETSSLGGTGLCDTTTSTAGRHCDVPPASGSDGDDLPQHMSASFTDILILDRPEVPPYGAHCNSGPSSTAAGTDCEASSVDDTPSDCDFESSSPSSVDATSTKPSSPSSDRPYRHSCGCGQSFLDVDQLTYVPAVLFNLDSRVDHIIIVHHHGMPPPYPCDSCDNCKRQQGNNRTGAPRFHTRKDLRRHLEATSAHPSALVGCRCGRWFRRDKMAPHLRKATPCRGALPFRCPCGHEVDSRAPDAEAMIGLHSKIRTTTPSGNDDDDNNDDDDDKEDDYERNGARELIPTNHRVDKRHVRLL